MWLAAEKEEYEPLVMHFLLREMIDRALDYLQAIQDKDRMVKLLVKYASVFMKYDPIKTVSVLRENKKLIDIADLVPTLIGVQNSLDHKMFVCNYVGRDFVERSSKNVSAVDNLYLFTLASGSGVFFSDSLKDFLERLEALKLQNQPIHLDRSFALSLCRRYGLHEALIRVYGLLEFYDKAVELALDEKDFDIAKEYAKCAQKEEKDREVSRRLWVKIAEAQMQVDSQNMEKTLGLLEESGGCLSINDILTMAAPKVKIKAFQDNLSKQYRELSKETEAYRSDISEYVAEAEKTRESRLAAEKTAIVFRGNTCCVLCKKPLLSDEFALFPCGHVFHHVRSCC